ncbi:MAG TPA: elongation factor 4 [Candidatus Taylorbacteria bacterium]|uniref:Elongation factor 4 n=1 Tax=Candidatus Kaiserbacteria bacterium GW2011_GWA2_49_56 TaxID=1618670 RepID=A0A0G1YSS1_9BACT|nr:MAG: Elongation factor 4 [Parcubacteria group bacterium GW2011_GWC2_48_17]KKW09429.1 MAG: Elongation factor 4 [Candidatus Kaiserbacteria bacterium GW2011_GWA2_49_56]HBV01308.1 elongation factor 4 [Candidatus Taylorbacteria bacterium]
MQSGIHTTQPAGDGQERIRNFAILAHIDHGKSTLADRLLEITGTIEKRKMRDQVLDSMELERERGITIKMTPVRMNYTLDATRYTLNLIDTPGHIDFAYEVSRAMKAVEGAIVLVDATQGVQAQTISVLQMAREANLKIIPAVNKIDSPLARVPETRKQIAQLVGLPESDVLLVSGKTGEGVPELLAAIVERIPSPATPQKDADSTQKSAEAKFPRNPALSQRDSEQSFRGLIFDFKYSNHAGVIVFLRVFGGTARKGDKLQFAASQQIFTVLDVGIFSPEETSVESLSAGEIGYITTGIKEPGVASVGDTILAAKGSVTPLPGYDRPKPVVWASIYPESQDDFNQLRQAIGRLRLSDSSFTYEEESGGLLGRGFRCGFLGMLHLEIITERLRREWNLSLVVTTPSITYEVVTKRGKRETVYSAARFPEYGEIAEVYEPMVEARIITPSDYMSALMPMFYSHEGEVQVTENFGDNRNLVVLIMPLRELMRGFFDEIKSLSSGFASLSYKIMDKRRADVVKLELLVAEEVVPAFSRIVSRKRVELDAEAAVEKLHSILPRQLFTTKIQGQALGRIISSRTVRAMAKDVTGYLYGGDRTRKMKLWQQQKEGKKRLKEQGTGRVRIPHDVFVKMVQS